MIPIGLWGTEKVWPRNAPLARRPRRRTPADRAGPGRAAGRARVPQRRRRHRRAIMDGHRALLLPEAEVVTSRPPRRSPGRCRPGRSGRCRRRDRAASRLGLSEAGPGARTGARAARLSCRRHRSGRSGRCRTRLAMSLPISASPLMSSMPSVLPDLVDEEVGDALGLLLGHAHRLVGVDDHRPGHAADAAARSRGRWAASCAESSTGRRRLVGLGGVSCRRPRWWSWCVGRRPSLVGRAAAPSSPWPRRRRPSSARARRATAARLHGVEAGRAPAQSSCSNPARSRRRATIQDEVGARTSAVRGADRRRGVRSFAQGRRGLASAPTALDACRIGPRSDAVVEAVRGRSHRRAGSSTAASARWPSVRRRRPVVGGRRLDRRGPRGGACAGLGGR